MFINFFSENRSIYEIMEKCGKIRQAADDDKYGICTLHAG
jgi:hypothetical protein